MKAPYIPAISLLATGMLPAAITPYSEDFSSGPGSTAGWADIGTTPTTIAHSTSASDGDASTPTDPDVDGGGDDNAGDGALFFDSANAIAGDETIGYTLAGSMEIGEAYTLDIAAFNPQTSFNNYRISLHNKTDDVELATTGNIGQNGGVVGCRERQLVVVPTVNDIGDQLEIRITENIGDTFRNIAVDVVTLSVGTLAEGITAISEDFSSGPDSIAGWTSTGAVATNLSHFTNANDSDDANYDPVNADGGGDDSAGDGALLFQSVNNTQGDEQISYVFEGSMSLSETYTLDIACYNPINSFNRYAVSLWNRTDQVMLADTGNLALGGGTLGCREAQLSYTPGLGDQGDQLEVRIVEDHNSSTRRVGVDVFSLSVGSTPSDTGLLQLVDLRLPGSAYAGAVTSFDPGFAPEPTRSPADDGPAGISVPATFRGTSQNPGDASPDPGTDIGLETFFSATAIQQINRFTSSTDGGSTGPSRVGAVQWSIDLGEVVDYLDASGKQLDTLDLRLVTDPSDDTKPYDVYLSYTLAGDDITLTDISPNDAGANYNNVWWPAFNSSEGAIVGGSHKILELGHTGNLDLTTDLAPLASAGVRSVNLVIMSGGFFSGRRISINENSGLTFRAIDAPPGTPFENFMANYPDLTGGDALPDADPDGDTLSNVEEFLAGGTAPNDGTAANLPVSAILNDGANDHFTYSILMPDTATFTGSPSPSATVEGITATVRGSLDLATFDRPVEETTRNLSLPADPAGYAWHTFRLVDPVPAQSRGFLQATYQ